MKKSIKYFRPLYVLLLLLVAFTALAIGLILSASLTTIDNIFKEILHINFVSLINNNFLFIMLYIMLPC